MLGKRGLSVFAFMLALCAVFVMLGSCPAESAAKAPYVIGGIFSVTGDNAPLGVPERDTALMLAKQINAKGGVNGHPVKVQIFDDAGKPEQAVQACKTLLANKNCVAIIGPTLTGPSLAIATICNDAKMPLLSCAASIKIVSPVKPYVFKTAQSDSLAVLKIVDYLKKKNIKKIAFINDSNAFGASGRDQWVRLSRPAGIVTIDEESFGSNDTDMTPQLTKIRAKNPQAVICWGTNPGPAVVARDMRRLGMKQLLVMSHGISNSTFIKLAGKDANGVVFPSGKIIVASQVPKGDPQRNVLMGYEAAFQKAYGKPATHFGGHAWDAFQLVVDALKKVGPNRAKIRSTIEHRRNFVGIDGVFNFSPRDHNGLDKSAFALVTIKNGKWALVK